MTKLHVFLVALWFQTMLSFIHFPATIYSSSWRKAAVQRRAAAVTQTRNRLCFSKLFSSLNDADPQAQTENKFITSSLEVLAKQVHQNDTTGYISTMESLSKGLYDKLPLKSLQKINDQILELYPFFEDAEGLSILIKSLADIGMNAEYDTFRTIFELLMIKYRDCKNKKRAYLIPVVFGLAKAGYNWNRITPNRFKGALQECLIALVTDLGKVSLIRKDILDAIKRFCIPWEDLLPDLRTNTYFALRMFGSEVDPSDPMFSSLKPKDLTESTAKGYMFDLQDNVEGQFADDDDLDF
jgi:hypothetical protein